MISNKYGNEVENLMDGLLAGGMAGLIKNAQSPVPGSPEAEIEHDEFTTMMNTINYGNEQEKRALYEKFDGDESLKNRYHALWNMLQASQGVTSYADPSRNQSVGQPSTPAAAVNIPNQPFSTPPATPPAPFAPTPIPPPTASQLIEAIVKIADILGQNKLVKSERIADTLLATFSSEAKE